MPPPFCCSLFCDGKLPACTACEKAGRENECSAANDQFARGKERSYVAALELRIEKLERRLAYARSRKASVALHEQDGPPSSEHPQDRKDSLANIRAAIHRKAERKRENSDVNALVSDFGYMSINATTRDFEPTLSNMTFARLVLAAVTNDPLPEPQSSGLPAKQTAHSIVQYYMTNIYPLFPLFLETVLLSALDDLYQQDRHVSSTNKWLVYMVLAIGSMAQSRSNQDEHYKNGVEFVSHALQFADRALQLGSVSQIQSLALFTQYAMLDPAHFDSWHLIGSTCRAVVDLGFHQDPSTQGKADRVALDMRRKTFYCVYALDRAISMVHARAFSFSDDAINVDLPAMSGIGRIASVAGPITGPQSHDPAILLFQLRRIQSHWYQTLIQSDPNRPIEGSDGDTASFIWQVCQDMREWDESLPDTLPIGIRELFNLELKYSYVYCLAPSARAPVMTAYGRVLIFEYAIAYVDHVYGIAAHGSSDPNPSFYTYHDALRVFFMGSQFMAVLRDAGDSILAGASVPVPLSPPGKAPPPPLPTRTSNEDNLTRSIRCLERVKLTLQKYGERWLDAQSLLQSFDTLSEGLIKDLKTKQQQGIHYAAAAQAHAQAQAQAHAQARMQPQHQYHQSPPPQQYQPVPVTMAGHMPGQMSLPVAGPLPGQMHPQMHPSHYTMSMQQSPMYVTTSPSMQQMSMAPPQGPPMHHMPNTGPPQSEVRWENVDISQMMRGGGM
ncbi:Positive regulator of purine utilization [Cytospora mali]|uniref:Positive regulator of purine utilization n=1 Tax=Cytospora mali TaxID=578113 RepID=A0A194UW35_CYTMA|nr:Positive regulator of purine utilization [Valsa mali var. pyri (nom. inval.)]